MTTGYDHLRSFERAFERRCAAHERILRVARATGSLDEFLSRLLAPLSPDVLETVADRMDPDGRARDPRGPHHDEVRDAELLRSTVRQELAPLTEIGLISASMTDDAVALILSVTVGDVPEIGAASPAELAQAVRLTRSGL